MSLLKSQSPASRLPNQPTLVEHGHLRFLITDCPSDSTLPLYYKEFEKYRVTDIVRVCHPTYAAQSLADRQIQVHDWPFDDGEAPPDDVISRWLRLVEERFHPQHQRRSPSRKPQTAASSPPTSPAADAPCIAVHCVAGLGRAPALVALALIEYSLMTPLDSVVYIRERRRGAINNKQLTFLERYKRRTGKRRLRDECRIL